MIRRRCISLLLTLTIVSAARVARADEIRVMTSGAFTAAYLELGPKFEAATGHRLVTEATSMGTGASSIEARLAAGDVVDVVIVADAALVQLSESGRIVPGSRVPLARSRIGMAVRRGAPKPDVHSVEALRQTLLSAKSIAYSASVSGTYLSTELFQRLGVADQVLPKSRRIDGERVGAVVARGEAEIGFQQISELLPEPGIDFVAPLPDAVQRTTVFSAGVAAASRHQAAARQLIEFLVAPSSAAAIAKTALEPIDRSIKDEIRRSQNEHAYALPECSQARSGYRRLDAGAAPRIAGDCASLVGDHARVRRRCPRAAA